MAPVFQPNYTTTARLGAAVWLLLLLTWRPDLHHDAWARLLLLLAVLVWVPLGFGLLKYPTRYQNWPLPWLTGAAGLLLVGAFHLNAGWVAAALALPWVAVTLWAFAKGVDRLVQPEPGVARAGNLALAAAQIFLPVGSLWALADRLGWQPLGFDPAIVLLTGVHFHYAGFAFTLLAGLAATKSPNWLSRTGALLAVVSVPLTAVGITATQMGAALWPETLAAASVALAGWLTAAAYAQLAWRERGLARWCWALLSLSLVFSMSLALLYALRSVWPLEVLQIPAMRAWHGTVNALGVAGAGLLGWGRREGGVG